jgi:hypothetical protein
MNNIVRPHKVLENKRNGVQAIKLTESPYSGIIFNYGKVDFDEQSEHLKLHFEYDIIDDAGVDYVKEELEQYLGDMLVEFITFGLIKNEITYTGGVDENRTGDPIEPDSQ